MNQLIEPYKTQFTVYMTHVMKGLLEDKITTRNADSARRLLWRYYKAKQAGHKVWIVTCDKNYYVVTDSKYYDKHLSKEIA